MNLDQTQTVGEIARQYPASVAVFEAFGIDYCCGGNRPLAEVCARKDLSVSLVVAQLSNALASPATPENRHWLTAPLSELTVYIAERHHQHAKSELPRLAALARKVEVRHGHAFPELHQIRELVDALSSEMSTHMLKEEQVLFPRIRTIEEAATAHQTPPPAFFGALINPIRHMTGDHDDTGTLFQSLRSLTHGFQPPPEACTSFHALFSGLAAFEKETHQHIHLENNVLFPRALAFEQAPSEQELAGNNDRCSC